MKPTLFLGSLVALFGMAAASASSIYIGDDAAAGLALTAGTAGPDTAGDPAGNLTYSFSSDSYENSSGSPLLLELQEVNFWANNPGTLTPFVAIYNGAGTDAGANYEILAVGDPIAGIAGLNNAAFMVGGTTMAVNLGVGEQLTAGFHQSTGMVPWGDGTGDYLKEGNVIPAVGGTLPGDTTWSGLGRSYRYNVGVDVVPEPSVPVLLALPAALGLLVMRRRRTV